MTADAVGGVWAYALELARALAAHGAETHLATMGPRPSAAQRAEADAAGVALHESDYALEWMDAPWDDVRRAGDWLLGLEARLAPDLVHLNGYAHGALGFRAPRVVVAHSDVCSWWRAVRGEEAPPAWDAYRDAVAAGLAAADALVAPTQAVAEGLDRDFGARVDALGGTLGPAGVAVRVVPNARRAADYPPARKEPVVLTAGRVWDDAKNVRAVARAAADLPWVAYVAGDATPPDGAGGAEPWDAAPATGAASVRWLGPLPPAELAAWMGRASVYALPARYEPFGLSALEAGLAGCALVLGDLRSLREVWGDAALFVAPDDAGQLAAALRTLAADDDYRATLGARARARALSYTPARMAAGYLDAYAAAADAHARRGSRQAMGAAA
jgi:glycosyltransferase involved in cell wall biosynthesis